MNKPEPADLLRLHRSTNGLDQQQINLIAEHAEVIQAEAGQVLQDANQSADALMLVVAGHLSLALALPGGGEKTIMFFGRDDQIGLLGLVHDDPIPVRVVALDQSLLVRIPRESALDLMREFPFWSRNLLQTLAPKIRNTLTALLIEKLSFIGESVGLMSDHAATLATEPARSASVIAENGELRPVDELRALLASWSDVDRMILDGNLKTVSDRLAMLLAACEAVYWFCSTGSARVVIEALKPLVDESPTLRDKTSIVHVLDDDEQVAPHREENACTASPVRRITVRQHC